MKSFKTIISFLCLFGFAITVCAQNKVEQIERKGIKRIEKSQKVQEKISEIHDDTRSMADDYQDHLKLVDGLRIYNKMLSKQLQNQNEEIAALQGSIANVATMERQILPLASRMIDGLEQFVAIDLPFLRAERTRRIDNLRLLLDRSDVTVAEKTRRVFEAYQIENDYGRTIESYKDKLLLGDASFDADFLRIGRVGLMYRTAGNGDVGYWDVHEGSWKALPKSPYKRYIDKGLKVAKQEVAPELISIPVNPEQMVSR
ncbi:MAG: DUF3450 domain-containing protein [Pseudomonadales bacterium]